MTKQNNKNKPHVWPRKKWKFLLFHLSSFGGTGIGDCGISGCIWVSSFFLHHLMKPCTLPSSLALSESLPSTTTKGFLKNELCSNLAAFTCSKGDPDHIYFLDWHVSFRKLETFSSSPVICSLLCYIGNKCWYLNEISQFHSTYNENL